MKIPLPTRGQPIDVPYITKIVEAVNDLFNLVGSTQSNYTVVDTKEAGRQTIQTGRSMMVGTSVNVALNEYVVKDTTKTWYVDLPQGFKYAPSVVAVAVNKGTTVTGNDAFVTITSVTKNRVDGIVKFLSSGTASIGVNVNAIGIPE